MWVSFNVAQWWKSSITALKVVPNHTFIFSFKLLFWPSYCSEDSQNNISMSLCTVFSWGGFEDINQSNHSLIGAVCVGCCVCTNTFLNIASVSGVFTTIKHPSLQPLLWFKPCLCPNLHFFSFHFFPLICLSFLNFVSFFILPRSFVSFVSILAFFTSNCTFFVFLLLERLDWLMKDVKA